MNFQPKQCISNQTDFVKVITIFMNMKMTWFKSLSTPNKQVYTIQIREKYPHIQPIMNRAHKQVGEAKRQIFTSRGLKGRSFGASYPKTYNHRSLARLKECQVGQGRSEQEEGRQGRKGRLKGKMPKSEKLGKQCLVIDKYQLQCKGTRRVPLTSLCEARPQPIGRLDKQVKG